MYLKYASKFTRTAIILFYVLCLLYVLSAASFVSDLVSLLLEVSDNSICKNIFFLISCVVAYRYIIDPTSR